MFSKASMSYPVHKEQDRSTQSAYRCCRAHHKTLSLAFAAVNISFSLVAVTIAYAITTTKFTAIVGKWSHE
jgi:hypothetical protein